VAERLFRILCLVLLLSACATQAPLRVPADAGVWKAHQEAVSALHDWQAYGRIAVRTDEDGWSAGFDWKQTGDDYLIRLRGPFGQGAMELEGNTHGVWLKRAGRPAVFSIHPERLLEQESGWRLPITGLEYWLRGLPDQGSDAQPQLDADGRLASLQQSGWQIDYRRYQDVGQYTLPTRLELQRDGLRVKVLVDNWELP
jgi:outer membrane lipoprotein LolB